MGYSVLNDYHYEHKSALISALDFISTPIRRILGGNEIRILHICEFVNNKSFSTADKVITASLLILIFPVGVITAGSLLLDIAAKKYLHENEKVESLSPSKTNLFAGMVFYDKLNRDSLP